MSLVRVHPIVSPQEFDQVVRLAAEDKHGTIAPTHWLEKDGHVAGAFAVNSIPFVSCWFSTKEMAARDTLAAINIGEAICESAGFKHMVVPCPEDSPLFKVVQKLDYVDTGSVHLLYKLLRKG